LENNVLWRAFPALQKEFCKDHTGWLGREDSNLRMAESKSSLFSNNINRRSEKAASMQL